MDARPATDNPLGLNLDFLYGRGFLWAEHENVSSWVTLERLRMEIPDLTFPFDVRGGLARFRDTRCMLRELDLRVSEIGLVESLRNMLDNLEGFSDLDVRFLDGVILFATRVRAFESDTFVTFRLGAMPGEAGSDVVRLLAHEFRAYGPLPCSARQLVHTLLKNAVGSAQVGAVGHGTSFAVELRGDSLLLRPLKLVLLHVFAHHGWKLPNLSRVVMGDLLCRPGGAVLRARAVDEDWTRDKSTGDGSPYLAAALAADEARSLFERGDSATYAGRNEEALRSYQSFQARYGTHPELVQRLLDVLLLDPTPGNLAEAEALCRDLEVRGTRSIVAAIGRARIADAANQRAEAITRWKFVSEILSERGETLDRTLCDVVIARHEARANPSAATTRLTTALRTEPRNRAALQELRDIYDRTRQYAELEGVLKRLTGVAPNNEALVDTYVDLALHLMVNQGQIAEARAFLERALRIAPNRFEILDALGETWVQSGDPARAVKTLGSAATAARQRGDLATASRLLFRIGRLWEESLGNREQALMQVRRALDFWEEGGVNDPLGLAEQLRYAAQLCEGDRQQSEAIAYWTEALAALQLAEARVDTGNRVEVRRALAGTHRDIAAAYRARGRHDVAASHERRLVEMDPTDVDALEAMESHYRREDGLPALVDTLAESVSRVGQTPESLALRTRLAERLHELDRIDDAIAALEDALAIAPGAERVRRLLAAILVEAEQPERLAGILTSLHQRVQQRDVKWAILVELGDLSLDVLNDSDAAAKAYAEAASALPARREPYTRARFVFEKLAADTDWEGPSPLGGTLSGDLLELWKQFAVSAPSADERARLRREVDELAEAMGSAAQQEALAWSIASEMLDEPPSGEIGVMFEDSWSEAEDGSPTNRGQPFARDGQTRLVSVGDASSEQTDAPWKHEAPTGLRQAEVETLEISRTSDADRLNALAEIAQRPLADDLVNGTDVEAPDPEPDFPHVPSSPRIEAPEPEAADDDGKPPSFSKLVSLKKSARALAEFREQYDESSRRPPALPDLATLSPDSALARILKRGAALPENDDEDITPADDDTPEEVDEPAEDLAQPSTDEIEKAISDARKSGDDGAMADALELLLEHGEVSKERRLDLTFELAELIYYELEDGDRALPWLLEVRRLDPLGYGARPGVLNAIEAIYEERGSVDGQVEILTARLQQAQNDDMRDTYRLLLAQLEWEERDDPAAARAWLDDVLERDDRHEGARRLLADIAEDANNWSQVAEHLRIALSVAGEGLDSVELQKRLAAVYLERLGDPMEALRHYCDVLVDAPQDAGAMDSIRRCQAALGDWDAYLKSLREELRLMLGLTLDASPEDSKDDWLASISPDIVAEPLRIPASHVLADIARVLQDELDRPSEAHAVWSQVVQLWPEHLEAVERRIDLDQKLEHHDIKS